MSMYRFAPLMALAGGAFAAPASAAVMSKNFAPWPTSGGTTTTPIVIGAGPAQYSFAYTPSFIDGNNIETTAVGTFSSFGSNAKAGTLSSTYDFPGAGDVTLPKSATVYGDGGTQYLQLQFDIGNQTNYGVATFDGASLTTIAYEAAVPEPAVWAQMIAGLSLAGVALRTTRRRRSNTIAA